jgi:hypothetical protein
MDGWGVGPFTTVVLRWKAAGFLALVVTAPDLSRNNAEACAAGGDRTL